MEDVGEAGRRGFVIGSKLPGMNGTQLRTVIVHFGALGAPEPRDSVVECGGRDARHSLHRRHRFRELSYAPWPQSAVHPAKAAPPRLAHFKSRSRECMTMQLPQLRQQTTISLYLECHSCRSYSQARPHNSTLVTLQGVHKSHRKAFAKSRSPSGIRVHPCDPWLKILGGWNQGWHEQHRSKHSASVMFSLVYQLRAASYQTYQCRNNPA